MNNLPDIEYDREENNNPVVASPVSVYNISFYQNKETAMDIENYRRFIDNAISSFRQSRTYKNYKAYLISNGLNRCQVHPNITTNMDKVTLEIHHNILTLFDIGYIISEYFLNTAGKVSTFDIVKELKYVHTSNMVQLIMLSLTQHQLYENTDGIYFHPDQCFGDWISFIDRYKEGIVYVNGDLENNAIYNKIMNYLDIAIKEGKSYNSGYNEIRQQPKNFGGYLK